jgi:hypothetical protein
MKKLARIAFLVATLMLSGFATANAWPFFGYVTCYYSNSSGGDAVPMETWVGECCGTQIQYPDGSTGYALWFEQMGTSDVCMI